VSQLRGWLNIGVIGSLQVMSERQYYGPPVGCLYVGFIGRLENASRSSITAQLMEVIGRVESTSNGNIISQLRVSMYGGKAGWVVSRGSVMSQLYMGGYRLAVECLGEQYYGSAKGVYIWVI